MGDLMPLDAKLRFDVSLPSTVVCGVTSWLRTLALFFYNYSWRMLLIADVPVPDCIRAFLNLLMSYD